MVRIGLLCLILAGLASCTRTDPLELGCTIYEAHEQAEVCDLVEMPNIVYEEMRQGLQGYYPGGDTLYVNEDLRGREKIAVIIHELVHYLDVMWGGLPIPGPASLVCASEDKAWFLEGIYWGMVGEQDKVRLDWWKSYPHCWPYYAPQQFMLTIQEWVDIMGIGGDPIVITVPNEPRP